jgi:hypothetical protein
MKWVDNIKMDLKEIRYRGVDQKIGSGYGRAEGSCEHNVSFLVP